MAENNTKRRGGFELNGDFPRILTLLRKERGYSQKKVAEDLDISQALLSHYEKGIRECGLSFVIRVADYYGVSCDYLLGRTIQRTGAVLSVQDDSNGADPNLEQEKGSMLEYDRRILINSLNIVFGILKKINSDGLTDNMTVYLSAAVYKTFRVLYSANLKNPQSAFSLDSRLFGASVDSAMAMAEAKSRYILSGEDIDGYEGVKKGGIPTITAETLLKDFPDSAPCLFDLIRKLEEDLKTER